MPHRIIFWIIIIIVAVTLLAIAIIFPDATDKRHPGSLVYPVIADEEGVLEQFQWPWYFAAIVVFVYLQRTAQRPFRPFFLLLCVWYAILGFRELDADKFILQEHWYNITRYLGNSEIPIAYQAILLSILVAIVSFHIWFFRKHVTAVIGWHKMRNWKYSHALIATLFVTIILTLPLDKYRTIRKHTGINLAFKSRVYVEESLELLTAICLFFASLEMAYQEKLAKNSDKKVARAEAETT